MKRGLKFSLEKEIKPQPERSEMDEHLYSKTESNAHG
jgi:hypothetical protein